MSFCKVNKIINIICKNYLPILAPKLLKQYNITSPNNLLFKIDETITINSKPTKILNSYIKNLYNKKEIRADTINIDEVPILPNMTHFRGRNNQLLTSFPVQPKMTYFFGGFNQLTSFPEQPNMEYFYGENKFPCAT